MSQSLKGAGNVSVPQIEGIVPDVHLLEDMKKLSFDPAEWMALLEKGGGALLGEKILQVLDLFHEIKFMRANKEQLHTIEIVAKLILRVFADASFEIPVSQISHFMERKTVLANMIRLTKFRNADIVIKEVLSHPNNVAKILILYSHYSHMRMDLEKLFAINPYLVSLWAAELMYARCWCTKDTFEMLQWIAKDKTLQSQYVLEDEQGVFPLTEDTAHPYFFISYIAPDCERIWRERINTVYKRQFAYKKALPEPDYTKILVVSKHLWKGHAVYRSLAPQLYALKDHYQLDLFHLEVKENIEPDHDLFSDVFNMQVAPDEVNSGFTEAHLERILAKGYGIILHADVGMTRPSTINANVRLAPIQVTMYGHPVTTYNSEIDYYIAGAAVEQSENAQDHYAERLVLVPGLGAEPDFRPYERNDLKVQPNADQELHIMCSWGDIKANYPLMKCAQEIEKKTQRRIIFNVVGITPERLAKIAIERDVDDMFGDSARVLPMLPREAYLKVFESCHVAMDAHPFGGFNRIVDAFLVGTPMIAWEGEKAPSRLAAAILRQLGLGELVATNRGEYIDKMVWLIGDDDARMDITSRIQNMDLEQALFNSGNEKYMLDAMDAIVADHHAGKLGKGPIIIDPRS